MHSDVGHNLSLAVSNGHATRAGRKCLLALFCAGLASLRLATIGGTQSVANVFCFKRNQSRLAEGWRLCLSMFSHAHAPIGVYGSCKLLNIIRLRCVDCFACVGHCKVRQQIAQVARRQVSISFQSRLFMWIDFAGMGNATRERASVLDRWIKLTFHHIVRTSPPRSCFIEKSVSF